MRRPDQKRFDFPTLLILTLPVVIVIMTTYRRIDMMRKNDQLIAAVQAGDIVRVKSMLDSGSDIDSHDYSGRTLLMIAADDNHPALVEVLLQRGSKVNARAMNGETALVSAVSRRPGKQIDQKIVRLLLDHGADVNLAQAQGSTALMCAASQGDTVVVDELLARHAKVDTKDSNGDTALSLSAGNSNSEMIRILLDHGANPNVHEQSSGDTPLIRAVVAGNAAEDQIVRLLLSHGARTDVKDKFKMTPLQWAMKQRRKSTAALLRNAGETR